ncbi:hypothetical protein I6A84_01185 [Frankia sp. CNm7]|uniref:Uncharacterized protein n=1 Tax=Frankia nepalensis TaxID=1836974 RepID=A0A937UQY1_9ACTN|nr:hypothetical protein [Frankia nepalensis]MBL7496129.1 hypothetical protein [Frankia nepalensis]MBL7508932.1 hypothetical protein [Frankia nepalensis]MBL7516772.1 hypothetical protein [Frankia nepalensis]MBL7628710.1 hypothetical protein [Frankia nepalensis]
MTEDATPQPPLTFVRLLGYRGRQRHAADLAFADMVADTERLGLYDDDPDATRAALKAARKKTQG